MKPKCPHCGNEGLLSKHETTIFVPLGDDFRARFQTLSDSQIGHQARANIERAEGPRRIYCPKCGNYVSKDEMRRGQSLVTGRTVPIERTSDNDTDDLVELQENTESREFYIEVPDHVVDREYEFTQHLIEKGEFEMG